jgi:tetratricopeptide (TPR) repeat protein
MALVESRLTGRRKLNLTSAAGALAERVSKLPHVAEVRLWPLPFELARDRGAASAQEKSAATPEMLIYEIIPSLRRGRALQFKGQYDGDEGAKRYYLNARPPDKSIEDFKLPDDVAKKIAPANIGRVEAAQILLLREAKHDASFWLGLIFFDQKDYANAIDYLEKRTLGAATKSPWARAARYNLARVHEAAGKTDEAIKLYESDADSPQSHGNRLRARWLKEKAAK